MTRLRQALDSQEARDCLDRHLAGNRIFFGRYTGRSKGGHSYLRPHEQALKPDQRGGGTTTVAEKVLGSNDPNTISAWKKSVASSRQRRIEDVLIELSSLDDLEAAIRAEAGLPRDQQVSCRETEALREKAFAFPSLDGAEMLTRWDMQEWPPDILVTNISMLNAMLSRAAEARMLAITRDWLASDPRNRFTLVIDELHLQRGSEGTEFIYLLRLLLVRLGLDQPERHHQLRLLASSASLPVSDDARDASLEYLYDAFADFGLPLGASQQDWLEAIVPGAVVPFARTAATPRLPRDPARVRQAVEELLASGWAPQDPDALLPAPDFERHGADLGRFLDALAVPPAADPLQRWHQLATATALALEEACHASPQADAVATGLFTIAERIWGDHGWDLPTAARILRVLAGVVGAVDRPGPIGERLLALRRVDSQPLPRFRVHTFFKALEGVFAEVVPPGRRAGAGEGRWQGNLSLERLGTRASQKQGERMARQFELLHCECCGENFLGGLKAGGAPLDASYVEEILPNEADTEKLPDLPVADRFEEFTYRTYAIVWPCDDNRASVDDPDNGESWQRIWLDPSSGLLLDHDRRPGELQPGYLFRRPAQEINGFSAQSPGSHMPCRCPRCQSDYAGRRVFKKSLIGISPIGPQRSGFGRAAQLLASETYDVLAREGEKEKARLVSFSDSRQGAARTALEVENIHHRDILREVLLVCLLQERRRSGQASPEALAELEELEAEIAAKQARGISESSPLLRPLLDYRQKLLQPLQAQRLGVIPLSAILDLEPPEPGTPVKPFIATLVAFGIHPSDERGLARVKFGPTTQNLSAEWWRLFDHNVDGQIVWAIPTGMDLPVSLWKRGVAEYVTGPVLRAIAEVVFRKTCFGLEATGFAYPVPVPRGKPGELPEEESLEEVAFCHAAAWLRIYADDYRLDPTPWRPKGDAIAVEKLEGGTSGLADLMRSLAHTRRTTAEAQGEEARRLLAPFGHSTPSRDCIQLELIGFRIPADSDPYWRCPNCRRVHLHRGLGACTRCGKALADESSGERGVLLRDNVLGRKLRRSIDGETGHSDIFRLRCAELTGQTEDPAPRQREFKGIRLARDTEHPLQPHGIEMLAVTTTMEVGIDIGPLEAVLQANMPPQRFNYQQRVGRAGRREQAFSFVLTLCRNRSHDLHYFRHPELITGETPPAPFLVKGLGRIADRLIRKDR
ncbi:MAG: helicase-related protein, partial [Synechococcaceae cyanobacterium]|nr:helicase-related protein [Synechococcaceae cyanobacterium]